MAPGDREVAGGRSFSRPPSRHLTASQSSQSTQIAAATDNSKFLVASGCTTR